jgi:hypothetical protein
MIRSMAERETLEPPAAMAPTVMDRQLKQGGAEQAPSTQTAMTT